MRRTADPTPRFDELRIRLSPCLLRRGAASRLARSWSAGGKDKRRQVSLWFKKGEGRPMATPTLIALRFLVAQPEWHEEEWYVPAWSELVEIVIPLLSVRGRAANLARFCDRELYAISRYFSRTLSQRREPDGEVALAVLDWLTRQRIEYALIDNGLNPQPVAHVWQPLERAFKLEQELKAKLEETERRQLYLPGNNLFDR
jgi:hypothetical protein